MDFSIEKIANNNNQVDTRTTYIWNMKESKKIICMIHTVWRKKRE